MRVYQRMMAWVWIVLICPMVLRAADQKLLDGFKTANLAYEQGNFKSAISGYQALLTNGWRSPAIYFNLGNAAFKAGRIGDSIYYYRKAKELKPRDADASANLAFARDSISAGDSAGNENQLLNFVSLSELLAGTFLFFWAVFILVSLRSWRPDWKYRINPWLNVAAIMFLASGIAALVAWLGTKPSRVAIAARSEVVARFGPLLESQTAFTVRDGAELAVAGIADNWVQIKDSRGRVAWVAKKDVHLFP